MVTYIFPSVCCRCAINSGTTSLPFTNMTVKSVGAKMRQSFYSIEAPICKQCKDKIISNEKIIGSLGIVFLGLSILSVYVLFAERNGDFLGYFNKEFKNIALHIFASILLGGIGGGIIMGIVYGVYESLFYTVKISDKGIRFKNKEYQRQFEKLNSSK